MAVGLEHNNIKLIDAKPEKLLRRIELEDIDGFNL